jgi:hypothetical protein
LTSITCRHRLLQLLLCVVQCQLHLGQLLLHLVQPLLQLTPRLHRAAGLQW